MTKFRFIEWSSLPMVRFRFRDGAEKRWFYHRLANAGRLQIGRLILMWPLPWAEAVRHLPGYGYERPSGVRAALGWTQRGKNVLPVGKSLPPPPSPGDTKGSTPP